MPMMLLALLEVAFVLSFAGSGYACSVASVHAVCADMMHSLAFEASRCAPMIVGFVFIGVSGASVVVMCEWSGVA
jgi:hypothetical protein